MWQDGPAFLTVASSAQQPEAQNLGTTIYLQGRGGNLVGIETRGGTHRYADLSRDVTASCTVLPGSRPLYVTVEPTETEMLVEARLYNICDPPDVGDASFVYNPCAIAGTPVATTLVPVRRVDAGSVPASPVADGGTQLTTVGAEHFAWTTGSLATIPECAK